MESKWDRPRVEGGGPDQGHRGGDAGATDQGSPAGLRHGHRRAPHRGQPGGHGVLHRVGGRRRSGGHGGGAGVGHRADPQSEVGKQLGMRLTPTLEFVLDAVPESARHIEDLLARPSAVDAGWRSRLRAPATPATPIRTSEGRRHDDETGRVTRACVSRQAAGLDLAPGGRPGPAAGRHSQGRPRRNAGPDGHRRPGGRGRSGHPAARAIWSGTTRRTRPRSGWA